jgi:peroxiredoxin family protein
MARARTRRPMTLIMISPEADKIHMALMLGATAAATGRPVTFFFSKAATVFLKEDSWAMMKTSDGTEAPVMDTNLEEKGIADSRLLLDGLAALDVRFVACETGLREHAIDHADVVTRPAVEISGLADILEKGEGGDWLTF